MTEAEWLACAEPRRMLDYLLNEPGCRRREWAGLRFAGDRKLRLFAVACCRQVWPQLTDPRGRKAVEVGERFADGLATATELADAWGAGNDANRPDQGGHTRASVVAATCAARPHDLARTLPSWFFGPGADQAALLRDVVGNPFARPLVVVERRPLGGGRYHLRKSDGSLVSIKEQGQVRFFDHAWLAWGGRTVPRLATAIYDERRFEDMPILADALLDAGADCEELLEHCRSPGPHARGCWCLDLLLGKS
jgi:hypothetical protein